MIFDEDKIEEEDEPVTAGLILINHKGYNIPCRVIRLDSMGGDVKNTLGSMGFSKKWGVFITRSAYGKTAIQPVSMDDWVEMKGSFKKWNDFGLDVWSWRKKG